MAAAAALPSFVPVEEYLHSSFEVDMDYIDGTLEERVLGENQHADLQGELITLFRTHRQQWQVKTFPEQRIRITPTRYRVPDLCVMPAAWKRTPIVTEAPLLCIEILSPEDRLSRIFARCEDYLTLGTPEVWIFDPAKRTAMIVRPGNLPETHREGTLTLANTPIAVPLAEVFAVLDDE